MILAGPESQWKKSAEVNEHIINDRLSHELPFGFADA